jgi:hypothetical protein
LRSSTRPWPGGEGRSDVPAGSTRRLLLSDIVGAVARPRKRKGNQIAAGEVFERRSREQWKGLTVWAPQNRRGQGQGAVSLSPRWTGEHVSFSVPFP